MKKHSMPLLDDLESECRMKLLVCGRQFWNVRPEDPDEVKYAASMLTEIEEIRDALSRKHNAKALKLTFYLGRMHALSESSPARRGEAKADREHEKHRKGAILRNAAPQQRAETQQKEIRERNEQLRAQGITKDILRIRALMTTFNLKERAIRYALSPHRRRTAHR